MIEHLVTWHCDTPGCETQQSTNFWMEVSAIPSTIKAAAFNGWVIERTPDGDWHYCRACADKREDGNG